jgi:hypothetical protein
MSFKKRRGDLGTSLSHLSHHFLNLFSLETAFPEGCFLHTVVGNSLKHQCSHFVYSNKIISCLINVAGSVQGAGYEIVATPVMVLVLFIHNV